MCLFSHRRNLGDPGRLAHRSGCRALAHDNGAPGRAALGDQHRLAGEAGQRGKGRMAGQCRMACQPAYAKPATLTMTPAPLGRLSSRCGTGTELPPTSGTGSGRFGYLIHAYCALEVELDGCINRHSPR